MLPEDVRPAHPPIPLVDDLDRVVFYVPRYMGPVADLELIANKWPDVPKGADGIFQKTLRPGSGSLPAAGATTGPTSPTMAPSTPRASRGRTSASRIMRNPFARGWSPWNPPSGGLEIRRSGDHRDSTMIS